MAEDYYKTLEVGRDASQADIQKAYRRLARKFHPDLNPDDKTAKKKFQEVQTAFDVLNDSGKRELYDRYGSSFESAAAGATSAGGWRTSTASPEDVDFSQFFGDRFRGGEGFADIFSQFGASAPGAQGRRSRTAPRQPGADLATELEVPFQTAVVGGSAEVGVERAGGKVDRITIKIPTGIDEGKKIRLRGQGEAGRNGGPAGDILITVHVAPHPFFRRRDDDLEVRLPITLGEAAEGAKIDVPTPRGTVSVRVPPRTSSGTRLRIKGQGIARSGATPGDLYAEVSIVMPKDLSDADATELRAISDRHPQNPRADLRW